MEFIIEDGKLTGIRNPSRDVHIPEGVKCLGHDVFNSLDVVRNVWFPSSLVDCHGLRVLLFRDQENVFVHKDNPMFASHEGVLYNKDMTVLLRCPMKKQGRYELAPTTKTIAEDAFCCSRLDEIILNEGLESIGRTVFCECWKLKWLRIPESVRYIDKMAFNGEYSKQGIVVIKDSYAHKWAKIYHERKYKCADFDEAADMERRLAEVRCARNEDDDDGSATNHFVDLEKEDLIIGRYWVFVRMADGRMRFVCGEAENDFILEVCSWKDVVSAAAGFHEVFAVLASGEVVWASNRKRECEKRIATKFGIQSLFAVGYLDWCRSVTYWRGVKSIVACEGRVAALTHGGTILSTSEQSGFEKPEDYDGQLVQIGVGKVKSFAVGWSHAAVLDSSGRVFVVGAGEYCNAGNVSDWCDVVDLDVFSAYFTTIQTVGLCSDGKVLHTLECHEIDDWEKIKMVSCLGSSAVAALDEEGNILIAGSGRYDTMREEISCWPRMSVVRGGYNTLVGVDFSGGIWVSGISGNE